MISIKPPNCTEAARAVYHRRHMPINLTTSSSSHRQQLNKETELLAAVTPVTPSWHETFCLSSTVGQTSYLPDSDGSAPNTATLCCHVSATPVTQGERGRTSPKWDSLRSVVSLQIQTESFPRLEAESYFYKSENPLGKLGSSSEDISVIPKQSCRESKTTCTVLRRNTAIHFIFCLSWFAHNADTVTGRQFLSLWLPCGAFSCWFIIKSVCVEHAFKVSRTGRDKVSCEGWNSDLNVGGETTASSKRFITQALPK